MTATVSRRTQSEARCRTCSRPCYSLRVIFVQRPRYVAQESGAAYVVCDGCLETLQRHLLAWTYCYLPRTVRS